MRAISNLHVIKFTNYSKVEFSICLRVQTQCAKRLKQALTYFEFSHKMLIDEQHVVISQAMIILNNIGQIHQLLQTEEGAKKCFLYLLTPMMCVQQIGKASQI
jgi:hypothetical protein